MADDARQPLDSDDAEAVSSHVTGLLERGDVEVVEVLLHRLAQLDPEPAYLEGLRKTADTIRETSSTPRPTIPSQVHFIWIGGTVPDAAVDNIVAWSRRASNSNWQITLWSDRNTTFGLWGQARIRSTRGLSQEKIETVIDPRLEDAYQRATTGSTKAYAFASDIARYSILHERGGVYADVDLGVGTTTLAGVAPALRAGDVPVLGPLLRDRAHLDRVLRDAGRPGVTGQPTREQIQEAVDHLLADGGYGNHFIGAQKGSVVMEKMIDRIATRVEGMSGEELRSAGPAVSGPFPLLQVVGEHLREEFGVHDLDRGEHPMFQRGGQQFQGHVDWLTPESENQS